MTEQPIKYGVPAKQLNIRLPDGLLKQFKIKCIEDDLSQQEAMKRLVRAYTAGRVDIATD